MGTWKCALERIYEKFKGFGLVDISDYSHKEKGYCSTKKGEIISYAYAKYIQPDLGLHRKHWKKIDEICKG